MNIRKYPANAGNVGGKFQDAGPMTFLSLSLLHQLAKANTAD